MSVTMTKTEGVTVLTLTSDPQSSLPPICQLCNSLCCSPMCCSVSQHLKKIQGTSQSALGTMQIMIGLLNIGIGVILVTAGGGSWELRDSWFPFWLGPLFMLFGVMNILSEKYPSPCLIILNVLLSIVGVAFAITAIVLYSIHLEYIWFWWECPRDDYFEYRRDSMPTPSPEELMLRQKCVESQKLLTRFLRSVTGVAVVLAAVELCVVISSAILGMKTLCCSKKSEKSPDELETYKPLLEEVTSNPTA